MARKHKSVPAWGPFVPIEQLLERNKLVTLGEIDAKTLKLYGIAPGYETKTLSALRWLGLIDDKGMPTAKLVGLRVAGDEFNVRLQKVIKEAYSDLLAKFPLEHAKKTELKNYFMQKYSYTLPRATIATAFLIAIAKLAKIQLSQELVSEKTEKSGEPRKGPLGAFKPKQKSFSQLGVITSDKSVIIMIAGKKHEFDLDNGMDKVIFEALSKELIKKWSSKTDQNKGGNDSNE
jgi:hypothetical protein